MTGEEATRYRAMVARCNFLGCDRHDVQHAKKEASMWVAKPCQADWARIARTGKHSIGGARQRQQPVPFWEGGLSSACAPNRAGRAAFAPASQGAYGGNA